MILYQVTFSDITINQYLMQICCLFHLFSNRHNASQSTKFIIHTLFTRRKKNTDNSYSLLLAVDFYRIGCKWAAGIKQLSGCSCSPGASFPKEQKELTICVLRVQEEHSSVKDSSKDCATPLEALPACLCQT